MGIDSLLCAQVKAEMRRERDAAVQTEKLASSKVDDEEE